jgi:putative membrane protein
VKLTFPLLPERYLLYARIVLIIFTAVGIGGMLLFPDWFPRLTPLNLLLNAGLLIAVLPGADANYLRWSLLCAVAGFGIELMGVRTGVIFGKYTYGPSLGFAAGGVPLMIAVNWWMTAVCAFAIASRMSNQVWLRALIGAALMTFLDALIEPLATSLNFWYFEGGLAPVRNYVAWFVMGFFLQLMGITLGINPRNALAVTVFCLQALLFIVLNAVNIFR